jgi:subtilase family serine protease
MKTTKIDQRKGTLSMGPWSGQRQAVRRRHDPARRARALRPLLEQVEARQLLSGGAPTIMPVAIRLGPPTVTGAPNQTNPAGTTSPPAYSYTPAQIQHAYGFSDGAINGYNDQIQFGNAIKGDGTGQTIAIVDAYDDPSFVDSTINGVPGGTPNPAFATSDLAHFDKQFGLPNPPSFVKLNQYGSTTNLPGTDPAGAGNPYGNWEDEEALDVEWAHAMAPGASIILVEANGATLSNMYTAVDAARIQPGVTVVSMSWGSGEFSGETSYDSHFQTPAGHVPITFVAASGDNGTLSYPAASPDVLSVGGTSLQDLDPEGDYPGTGPNGEVSWYQVNGNGTVNSSGGGVSSQEPLPTYQSSVVPTGTNPNTTKREGPDVAYNAGYGVDVYDSYNETRTSPGPWESWGGTSAGAPQWAALIAIADQGRALYNMTSLDGRSQTLPILYSAPSIDFNDITNGHANSSGYKVLPGYDMVTGLGTPNAALVVYSLIGQNFYLINGVLVVNGDQLGTNYNDIITVGLTGSGGEQVTLNGMVAQFKAGTISSVVVNTDGGDNVVNIEATASNVPVSVGLQGGIGTVNITPSSQNLGLIRGNVIVTGGNIGINPNPSDALNIYDQGTLTPETYSVTTLLGFDSTVTRTNMPGTISYSSIDNVNIYGTQGNGTYNVESTVAGSALSILGGAGDDTFNISPTDKNLNNIRGNVTIVGGDGNNILNVYDQNGLGPPYTLSPSSSLSSVTRTGAATISFASITTGTLYYTGGTMSL